MFIFIFFKYITIQKCKGAIECIDTIFKIVIFKISDIYIEGMWLR